MLQYFDKEKFGEITSPCIFTYHYLYNWIVMGNEKPKVIVNKGNVYYSISIKYISECLPFGTKEIGRILKILNEVSAIKKLYHIKEKMNLIGLNIDFARKVTKSEYQSRLDEYETYENELKCKGDTQVDGLFGEIEIEKILNNKDAVEIVNSLILENDVFTTKIPSKRAMTKVYKKCCKIVEDIYNGNYAKSHEYDLGKQFEESSRTHGIEVEGWREKIESVKGDWSKVRRLLSDSVHNYRMMFDKKFAPLSKKNLTHSLDKWLYDDSCREVLGHCMSYFVQSLNEPSNSIVAIDEKMADTYFGMCPKEVRRGGNAFRKDNPSITSGKHWKNVYLMYEWGKALHDVLKNESEEWIGSPDMIVSRFYDFCEDKNATVNDITCDVEYCAGANRVTMWSLFILSFCKRYGISRKLVKCTNADMVRELRNKKK